MKKLRALFAILLAVCMLCSMAIAETEVEEVVLDEVVVTEAPADADESTETKDDNHSSEVDTTEEITDTTDSGEGDGKEHNVNGDPLEARTYSYQLHEGETVEDLEALIAGKKGDIVKGKYEVYQAFDCKNGIPGIYRFKCMLGKIDEVSGDPIWHEFVIPAEHKWASEEHETNKDWGIVISEAGCKKGEEGLAKDYCLRCGTDHKDANGNLVTRVIAPMGHSFQNIDDQRVVVELVTAPTCLKDGTKYKKDGTIALKCAVCGEKLYDVKISAEDMIALIAKADGTKTMDRTSDLTKSTSVAAAFAADKWLKENELDSYTWFNEEAFRKAYHEWIPHDWDKWIPEKAATCSKLGAEVRYCKICATKVYRLTPPLTANYKLDPSQTKLLDCYHEAQVWVCQNCKGACKNHPNIIKVRKVTSHTKDKRVAAIIDAAEADPVVKDYYYTGNNGKKHYVYHAPTCTEDGWKYYICEHEEDAAHQLDEATIVDAFKKNSPVKYWELWKGNDKIIGYSFIYDTATETTVQQVLVNKLSGTDVLKVLTGEKIEAADYDKLKIDGAEKVLEAAKDVDIGVGTKVSKELDDWDLTHYYKDDNLGWASESYKNNVFKAYTHEKDIYGDDAAETSKNVKGYYINLINPELSYFGESIKALGHDWSEWIERYKKDQNGAGNEYAYYIRVCKRCGKTEELVGANKPSCDTVKESHNWEVKTTTEPTCTTAGQTIEYCTKCGALKATNTVPALGHIEKVLPAVAATTTETGLTEGKVCERCGEVLVAQTVVPVTAIENKYSIGLDNVTVGSETRGTGTVKLDAGNQPVPALYARVTWVYELADGSSFAYTAMKDVKSAEDALTFNMTSPKQPYGAKLTDVQIALVTDAEADQSGSYNPLALAKK